MVTKAVDTLTTAADFERKETISNFFTALQSE